VTEAQERVALHLSQSKGRQREAARWARLRFCIEAEADRETRLTKAQVEP
jgi:hypothetical protein